MTNKKYISYKELITKENFKQSLEDQGFIMVKKKPLKVIAYIIIGVGVVTIPLPCGSFVLIGFGLSLLGLNSYKLKESIRKAIFKFKMRFRK